MKVLLAAALAGVVGLAHLLAASPPGRQGVNQEDQGNPHFSFLPPLAPASAPAGLFDASIRPEVQICEITPVRFCDLVVRFTMATSALGDGIHMDVDAEHFLVQWHTSRFTLNTARNYRIRVLAAGFELGHLDVDLVDRGADVQGAGAPPVVRLLNGRTLPIKFRIEQNALLAKGDELLVELARALLTAADPVEAYQTLFDHVAALFATVGVDEAQHRLDVITALAFDPVGDLDVMNRVRADLGGHEFSPRPLGGNAIPQTGEEFELRLGGPFVDPAPASSAAAIQAPGVPAFEKPVTTLIFINGILTNLMDYQAGVLQLGIAARQPPPVGLGWNVIDARRSLEAEYRLTGVFNPSNPMTMQVACAHGDLRALARDTLLFSIMPGQVVPSLSTYLRSCTFVQDFLESAVQMLNIVASQVSPGTLPQPIQDAAEQLARVIQRERDLGRSVIVVPHSQGNLMTIEALTRLDVGTRSCVGVVAIASPTSAGWPSPPNPQTELQGFIVEGSMQFPAVPGFRLGDVLLWIPNLGPFFFPGFGVTGVVGNHSPPFARISSNVTDAFDQQLAQVTLPEWIYYVPSYAKAEHSLIGSYFSGDTSRQMILQQLGSVDNALIARCQGHVEVTPDAATIAVGEALQLAATVRNSYGDDLPNHVVEWVSGDTAVAEVSSNGLVTPRSAGVVTITASSTGSTPDTAEVAVTQVGGVFFVARQAFANVAVTVPGVGGLISSLPNEGFPGATQTSALLSAQRVGDFQDANASGQIVADTWAGGNIDANVATAVSQSAVSVPPGYIPPPPGSIGHGSAESNIDFQFRDTLTVVSATLPSGSPVRLRLTLILDAVAQGSCAVIFTKLRVNAFVFVADEHVTQAFGFLNQARLCQDPQGRTVDAVEVIVPVGARLTVASHLVAASYTNSSFAPVLQSVASGTATFFLDPVTPGVTYHSASGRTYVTPAPADPVLGRHPPSDDSGVDIPCCSPAFVAAAPRRPLGSDGRGTRPGASRVWRIASTARRRRTSDARGSSPPSLFAPASRFA